MAKQSLSEKVASLFLEFLFNVVCGIFVVWFAGYVVQAYWEWFGSYVMQNPPHVSHLMGSALFLLAGLFASPGATILLSEAKIKSWKIAIYIVSMWLIAYPVGFFYHWLLF